MTFKESPAHRGCSKDPAAAGSLHEGGKWHPDTHTDDLPVWFTSVTDCNILQHNLQDSHYIYTTSVILKKTYYYRYLHIFTCSPRVSENLPYNQTFKWMNVPIKLGTCGSMQVNRHCCLLQSWLRDLFSSFTRRNTWRATVHRRIISQGRNVSKVDLFMNETYACSINPRARHRDALSSGAENNCLFFLS